MQPANAAWWRASANPPRRRAPAQHSELGCAAAGERQRGHVRRRDTRHGRRHLVRTGARGSRVDPVAPAARGVRPTGRSRTGPSRRTTRRGDVTTPDPAVRRAWRRDARGPHTVTEHLEDLVLHAAGPAWWRRSACTSPPAGSASSAAGSRSRRSRVLREGPAVRRSARRGPRSRSRAAGSDRVEPGHVEAPDLGLVAPVERRSLVAVDLAGPPVPRSERLSERGIARVGGPAGGEPLVPAVRGSRRPLPGASFGRAAAIATS